MRWQNDGRDDNQPATLRSTHTRRGALLESVKEVKPLGAADIAWRVPNTTRLSLQP